MRLLPLRSTVAARLSRLAGRGGAVLLGGLWITACSFTTDFDAPYPGDPATDGSVSDGGPDANVDGVCGLQCRATVLCLGNLDCPGSAFPDVMARFEGHCRAKCLANGETALDVGNCGPQAITALTNAYGRFYTDACSTDESQCEAYCQGSSDNGDTGTSSFGECVERAALSLGTQLCQRRCAKLKLEFWRCLGAAYFDAPLAEKCENEHTCIDEYPIPPVLGN